MKSNTDAAESNRPKLEHQDTPAVLPSPNAIILVANGTEEIEFATVYDILVRAGMTVQSVGVGLDSTNSATLSRGMKVLPDRPRWDASLPIPEILVIPGGVEGSKTMCNDGLAQHAIRRCAREGRWVGAICAGTTAVVKAFDEAEDDDKKEGGPMSRVKVTSFPGVKDDIVNKGWEYSEERVQVDGKVITSRAPGTALLFALTIVEHVIGKDKREEISGPLLLPEEL